MLEVGVYLAFACGGFALLMLWLGTRPASEEPATAMIFVRCANCLGEVRATRLTCPSCGSDQLDSE
jgi:hypothetical protein